MLPKPQLIGFALLLVWTLGAAAKTAGVEPPPSSSIGVIDSVAITVGDADRAAEFYSRVLTFEKVADREVAGEDSLRQAHTSLVSSSLTHLGQAALGWQDAFIARDPDGHTALIAGTLEK